MITFKNIEEKDQPFSEMVYRSAREQELALTNWTELQKEMFIKMQSMAQMADYKRKYNGATYQIINYKNKPAGRLFLWENNLEIKVIDIALLPAFQRKGIGKKILGDIMASAKQQHKPVTLHVFQNNPAKSFYEALGFKKTGTSGVGDYMEWRADKPTAGGK